MKFLSWDFSAISNSLVKGPINYINTVNYFEWPYFHLELQNIGGITVWRALTSENY